MRTTVFCYAAVLVAGRALAFYVVVASAALLVATALFGITKKGATRWLNIGVTQIQAVPILFGYNVRAVGFNPGAAENGGISIARTTMSMARSTPAQNPRGAASHRVRGAGDVIVRWAPFGGGCGARAARGRRIRAR